MGSFIVLILIRAIMGLFEGPVLPIAQAFTLTQSTPSRRGFNMGVGLGSIMWLCTGCMIIATLLGFAYYETAPMVLSKADANIAAE